MAKLDTTKTKKIITLSAIDPYRETHTVDGTQKEMKGYDFIGWGSDNNYPSYLQGLYESVPTLQSVINACVDYAAGENISLSNKFDSAVNEKGDTPEDLCKALFLDLNKFGGFAINVVRNRGGEIAALHYVNLEYIRTDKECQRFFYSEEWNKGRRAQYVEYPAFRKEGKEGNSIFYYKNQICKAYPVPVYASAQRSCEIEKSIDEYHLNAVNNAFMGSYIVNFNSGMPSEEIQQEIEDQINEKFGGVQNAGRILVSFNKDKDSAVSVEKLDTEDYGDHYKTLAERSQSQIFVAFRCSPALAGIPTNGGVINGTDYKEAFKLFEKTTIHPEQKIVARAFKSIFGEDVLTITPFSIDWSADAAPEQKVTEQGPTTIKSE